MSEERLLRLPEVLSVVGYQKSQVYRLIQAGQFPKPLKRGSTSSWVKSEIDAYVATVIANRDRVSA